MRALLEKDLRLILIRKSTLVIYIVIGVIFTWSFSDTFSGAYLTMLGTILALSTISYDDSDNCMSFLFTLPCTRKQYVIEKYLFVYGFSFIAGMTGLIIILVAGMIRGIPVDGGRIIEILSSEIPIFVVTGGLMIPLQLKYGPEKSRMVLLVIIGGILAAGYMASQIPGIDSTLEGIGHTLTSWAPAILLICSLMILLVLSGISVFISSRILAGKEY